KIAIIWNQLGVTCLDELKAAIDGGKLAKLKGFGAKSVEQIKHGIEFVQRATGRTPLGLAWPLGQELVEAVRGIPNVKRAEAAGSLRRCAETIGDIDVVCESAEGQAVVNAFTTLPNVTRVLSAGDTKGSIIVRRRDGFELQAQLRVV